jgi:hypothetical protein
VATAKDETPAEKISRLEKELAEARAEAEKHTAIDAAEKLLAWLEGEGEQPTQEETALLLAPLEAAGLVTRSGSAGRSGTRRNNGDYVEFDAEKALAWLANNSPARIQEINKHANGDGRRMAGTIADMKALEGQGVTSTGKGPATFYSYRTPDRRG